MSTFEKKKNMKALFYTFFAYGLVIVVCLLVGFSAPPPLPNQDMGMEINLGTSQEGTGSEQPLNPNPPAVSKATPSPAQASPASNETGNRTEDIVTQNSEDAPAIQKVPVEKKKEEISKNLNENVKHTATPRPDAPVEPKPTRKPKAVYSGGASSNASSGNNAAASNGSDGEGLTGKAGDQGAVNGNPNASNHNGVYSGLGGNSLSYRLSGRRIVQYPSREGAFNEPGRVRLNIKVDQQGNVIGYSVISADNPVISRLAEKKIKEIKFNANPEAPVIQFGEIVFVFKLQQ